MLDIPPKHLWQALRQWEMQLQAAKPLLSTFLERIRSPGKAWGGAQSCCTSSSSTCSTPCHDKGTPK